MTKQARITFKVDIEDSDTDEIIVDKIFSEVESYLDVVGIRREFIEVVEKNDVKEGIYVYCPICNKGDGKETRMHSAKLVNGMMVFRLICGHTVVERFSSV